MVLTEIKLSLNLMNSKEDRAHDERKCPCQLCSVKADARQTWKNVQYKFTTRQPQDRDLKSGPKGLV